MYGVGVVALLVTWTQTSPTSKGRLYDFQTSTQVDDCCIQKMQSSNGFCLAYGGFEQRTNPGATKRISLQHNVNLRPRTPYLHPDGKYLTDRGSIDRDCFHPILTFYFFVRLSGPRLGVLRTSSNYFPPMNKYITNTIGENYGLVVFLAVGIYYVYLCSVRVRHRSNKENEALRRKMRFAAEERTMRRNVGITNGICSGNSQKERMSAQKKVPKLKHHRPSNRRASSSPKGPRKATLAEETKDREEKLSMKQFGFSIYGNQEYCQFCGTDADEPTHAVSFSSSSCFGSGIHQLSVIPDLPGSQQALHELQRLQQEFEPVLQARGWKVLLLSEMCCCGDGDARSSIRPDNVMGYCVSRNDNRVAESIHIRLRPPHSCGQALRIYPYEELVKTMVGVEMQLTFHLTLFVSPISAMNLLILQLVPTTVVFSR